MVIHFTIITKLTATMVASLKIACFLVMVMMADALFSTEGCGDRFKNDTSGVVTSPLYPSAFPPWTLCDTTIQAPENHVIRLNFTHFELRYSRPDCHLDGLSLTDTLITNYKYYGRYCGTEMKNVIFTSRSPHLNLYFKSDRYSGYTGYSAKYWVFEPDCMTKDYSGTTIRPCNSNAECVNNLGENTCKCKEGFTGDGATCQEQALVVQSQCLTGFTFSECTGKCYLIQKADGPENSFTRKEAKKACRDVSADLVAIETASEFATLTEMLTARFNTSDGMDRSFFTSARKVKGATKWSATGAVYDLPSLSYDVFPLKNRCGRIRMVPYDDGFQHRGISCKPKSRKIQVGYICEMERLVNE